jgi:hypothetical protein
MADDALRELQCHFGKLYAKTGRPSIAPEKLLRALLLQVLYSVPSERMLMEQLDYNLLFRWFVGLNMDVAFGTRPFSRRTVNVCRQAILLMLSLRRCSSRHACESCYRPSTLPWTDPAGSMGGTKELLSAR